METNFFFIFGATFGVFSGFWVVASFIELGYVACYLKHNSTRKATIKCWKYNFLTYSFRVLSKANTHNLSIYSNLGNYLFSLITPDDHDPCKLHCKCSLFNSREVYGKVIKIVIWSSFPHGVGALGNYSPEGRR